MRLQGSLPPVDGPTGELGRATAQPGEFPENQTDYSTRERSDFTNPETDIGGCLRVSADNSPGLEILYGAGINAKLTENLHTVLADPRRRGGFAL